MNQVGPHDDPGFLPAAGQSNKDLWRNRQI